MTTSVSLGSLTCVDSDTGGWAASSLRSGSPAEVHRLVTDPQDQIIGTKLWCNTSLLHAIPGIINTKMCNNEIVQLMTFLSTSS